MPHWLPPVLIALVIVVVIAAVDFGNRGQAARADDEHWFGGIFYFNREDSRNLRTQAVRPRHRPDAELRPPGVVGRGPGAVIIAVLGAAGHQS